MEGLNFLDSNSTKVASERPLVRRLKRHASVLYKSLLLLGTTIVSLACHTTLPEETPTPELAIVGDWVLEENWYEGEIIPSPNSYWRFDADGVIEMIGPGATLYGNYTHSPSVDSIHISSRHFQTIHARYRYAGDTLKLTATNSDGSIGRTKLIRLNYTSNDSAQKASMNELLTFEFLTMTQRKGTNVYDLRSRVVNNSAYSYRKLNVNVELFGDSSYWKAIREHKVARYRMTIDILRQNTETVITIPVILPEYEIVAGPGYVVDVLN